MWPMLIGFKSFGAILGGSTFRLRVALGLEYSRGMKVLTPCKILSLGLSAAATTHIEVRLNGKGWQLFLVRWMGVWGRCRVQLWRSWVGTLWG